MMSRRGDSFDLGMGGGGSQPDSQGVGRGDVGDSEPSSSSSRLLTGRLHVVPEGDRGSEGSRAVWEMLRQSLERNGMMETVSCLGWIGDSNQFGGGKSGGRSWPLKLLSSLSSSPG